MNVPKKISERILAAMRSIRPVIEQQKSRDVSEADTVTLVKDLLSSVLGYDKYAELTGEHAIRGTYCDIAVQVKGQIVVIVEVKAVGISLDDKHVKQAVDYAANQGVDWVILTNASVWRLYRVVFAKPIDKHLVMEVDLLSMDYRKEADAETIYPFTKEALLKGVPAEILDRQLALSRHMLAALLMHNDQVVSCIRRELKRVADVNVDSNEIVALLESEVIKRDALDGQAAIDAANIVNKREARKLRAIPAASGDSIKTATPSESESESSSPPNST